MPNVLMPLDYIIRAEHISPDGTARGYYLDQLRRLNESRGLHIEIKRLDDPTGPPVQARIYQGQWIADCDCRGASYVSPDFPSFFCFSCGNRANDGAARPVVFPPDRQAIEALILARPVDDAAGLTDADRAGLARPMLVVEGKGALARNWNPDETLADLHEQQDAAIAALFAELGR